MCCAGDIPPRCILLPWHPSSLSHQEGSRSGPFSSFGRCPSEVCLSTTVFWNKILGLLFNAAKVYSIKSKEMEL